MLAQVSKIESTVLSDTLREQVLFAHLRVEDPGFLEAYQIARSEITNPLGSEIVKTAFDGRIKQLRLEGRIPEEVEVRIKVNELFSCLQPMVEGITAAARIQKRIASRAV